MYDNQDKPDINSLEVSRELWEQGFEPKYVTMYDAGTCLVVLKSGTTGYYRLHRYFSFDNRHWDCSVDANHIEVDKVWGWLKDADPKPFQTQRAINCAMDHV